MQYFARKNPHIAGIFARCGCAQLEADVEFGAVLADPIRIVVDGDVRFQQNFRIGFAFKVD